MVIYRVEEATSWWVENYGINTAEFPYLVHCTWGSPLDGLTLVLTAEQRGLLPDSFCPECLVELLRGECVQVINCLCPEQQWSLLSVEIPHEL